MVNRLLRDADGRTRLVVALDEHARPVAPVLIESFETLEKKPGDDDPEGSQRKDEADRTHAPAALAYALWPFEQEFLASETEKIAAAAARGRR
jgi:hypothetical protein